MSLKDTCIVTIDDTPSIRTFLKISLENKGAKVHEAANAQAGLKLVQDVSPDVVILDLGLPDKDGLDVLPEIKQSSGVDHTMQVIILTVRKERQVQETAFERGADAYVTKPFLMEDLLETIEERVNASH